VVQTRPNETSEAGERVPNRISKRVIMKLFRLLGGCRWPTHHLLLHICSRIVEASGGCVQSDATGGRPTHRKASAVNDPHTAVGCIPWHTHL